jgi:hypothetical protein
MKGNWINVEDRLPLTEADLSGGALYNSVVVLCSDRKDTWVAEYQVGTIPTFWGAFGDGDLTTHWQPLPPPSK